jgi:hypothetical protein
MAHGGLGSFSVGEELLEPLCPATKREDKEEAQEITL